MGKLSKIGALCVAGVGMALFQNCSFYSSFKYSTGTVTDGESTPSLTVPIEERSPLVSAPILEPPYKCADRNLVHPSNMKRLSRNQFINTVRDLIRNFVSSQSASALFSDFYANLNLPEDSGAHFSRTDTTLTTFHARGYVDAAIAIAAKLASDAYREEFLRGVIALEPGSCANLSVTNPSALCRAQLVRNLGLRILRRPLAESGSSADSLTHYLATLSQAATLSLGIENLVFEMLLSPYSLNQIQDDGSGIQGNLYSLSSYALVSKLSYALWNTMPDEGLLKLAGQLDTKIPADVEKAILYIFSKPERMDSSIGEFFIDWLGLEKMPRFADNGTEKFAKLSQGLSMDESLRQAMIDEVVELGRYVVRTGGTFRDLYTTNISLARHPSLLAIYGLSSAAPQNVTDGNAIRFPAGERSGLLTRAAVLLSDTLTANPVRRGVRLRRDILCQNTPAPPSNLADQIQSVQLEVMATTRTRYQKATAQPVCMSCHTAINPIGFSMANYNSFGKFETHEPIFDLDGFDLATALPIDSGADLSGLLGETFASTGPIALSEKISETMSAQYCFTEKISAFALERMTDNSADLCMKDDVFSALRQGDSLQTLLRILVRSSNFSKRLVEP